MKHLKGFKFALPLFILAVLLHHPILAHAITLGLIGNYPAHDIKVFLPLAKYLTQELRDEGVTEGKVLVAQDIAELAGFLREGKIDLHIDSYVRALALTRLVGSRPLLRRWKKGVAEYHGLIFVRQDSNISKLEELRGKTVAFDEPLSAVGYLLPKMMLTEKGLKPVPASTPWGLNGVGYLFAERDENTMQWVLSGRVTAGAMDHQRYPTEAGRRIGELRILEKTPTVPRHIVGARAYIPEQRLNRIKEILMRMDLSEEGRKILRDLESTTRFDELTKHEVALAPKLKTLLEAELKLR
jgi:phosphonate transport system substrate-binding protein